ncbi:MAG: SPOR domain-containing protein [Bacteroidales bacterium]|nr:SPOR domain-containing protein [Bacteroidales bacterium]
MKKRFNLGNVLLLTILSLFIFLGCSSTEKASGDQEAGNKEEEVTREDTTYYVQAGAFHNQDYAHVRAKELSRKFAYQIEITREDNLYRIKLGPFKEKPKARECRRVLIKEGYEDAFINTPSQQE